MRSGVCISIHFKKLQTSLEVDHSQELAHLSVAIIQLTVLVTRVIVNHSAFHRNSVKEEAFRCPGFYGFDGSNAAGRHSKIDRS